MNGSQEATEDMEFSTSGNVQRLICVQKSNGMWKKAIAELGSPAPNAAKP